MPTYHVTSPDGHVYEVTAPEGAAQADVLAYAKQHYGTAAGNAGQRIVAMPDGTHVAFPTDMPPDHIRALIAQKFPNDPHVQNASQGHDVGVGGAFGHGLLDAATFGLADKALPYAAAALSHVTPGADLTVDQARGVLAGNEAATDAAHPYAHGGGELAGAVAGGGALERGAVAALSKVAPKATAAVRDALALRAGQPVANAGRMAARGAASGAAYGGTAGAVQGAQDDGLRGAIIQGTEDTLGGAAAGALLAPAATGAVKIIGGASRLLQGPAAAALRKVAQSVKLPNETFDQASQRVANDAQEFQSKFGRYPAMAELSQVAQSKELGDVIRRTTGAQQFAAQAEERAAVARQAELSNALKSGGRTAAQADVEAQASQNLTGALQPIQATKVQPTQQQSDVLRESEPDLFSVLKGAPYASARDELTDHITQGAPISLRTIETLRQAAGRAARSSDPVVAHSYKGLRDAVRGIGEAVPEYRDAMNQYAQQMRFAENLPEGANALNDSTTPNDFAAGYRNQQPTPVGVAAQEGQRVGLRTAVSQRALNSPNAAADLSARLAESEGLNQKLVTALGPQEAADVRRTGEMALKGGRGMAAAVPSQTTNAAQATQVQNHAIRAAALGLHGGSTAFMSHNLEFLISRVGLPRGTALKVAQLSMDPKNTAGVLRYLKQRGTTSAQRHEYMNLVRAAVARAGAYTAAASLRPELTQ